MSYLEDNLADGETVLYRTRRHWFDMLFTGAVLGCVTLGFFVAVMPGAYSLAAIRNDGDALARAIIGATLLIFSTVVVGLQVLAWRSSHIALTNLRVSLTSRGWRRGDTGDTNLGIPISEIENIQVDQDFFGRLVGYGTITIRVKGSSDEMKLGTFSEEFCQLVQERIGGPASATTPNSSS